MAKGAPSKRGMPAFERSGKDREIRGKGREGSRREAAFDRQQFKGVSTPLGGGSKRSTAPAKTYGKK